MSQYILYSIISLGISLVGYHIFLKKEKCFEINRFYLLGTLLLCLIAPTLEFSMPHSIPQLPEITLQTFSNSLIEEKNIEKKTIEVIDTSLPTSIKFIISLYIVVSLILLIRFGKHLLQILKCLDNVQFKSQGLNVIFVDEEKNSFSFFNYLFIHPKDFENRAYSNTIIKHERIHSEQLHSVDLIIVELLACFFWFNPFIWFFKMAIVQNHEFIADDSVVKYGIDLKHYANTIIQSGNKHSYSQLSSGFNFIQTKNRIIMLNQSKSSIMKQSIKVIAALTLFAAVFTISSCTNTGTTDTQPQLIVVVDAGHGGEDTGNLQEKEVVLQISKALATYSNHKVKIIETRTSDEFLTLKERVDFINQQNPDLLISLHCNAHKETSTNGAEAFYYENNDFKEKSHTYSKLLLENQIGLFSERGAIKTAGFYILKNSDCPSVVLELGFITNEKDRSILMDSDHQQTIAKSLFESLLEIRDNKTN